MSIARTSSGSARTVLRFLPRLGLLLAVIAIVLLALVPLGWRGGWWSYRFSLLSLMAYSARRVVAASEQQLSYACHVIEAGTASLLERGFRSFPVKFGKISWRSTDDEALLVLLVTNWTCRTRRHT
jgi:hypothetical protein